jgi:hypothetical protein
MANKSSTITTNILDATQKVSDELLSAVKQSQGLTLDVARAIAETWPSAPAALSGIPQVFLPEVEAVTGFAFGLASNLIVAQKDFAETLVNSLTPAKTA